MRKVIGCDENVREDTRYQMNHLQHRQESLFLSNRTSVPQLHLEQNFQAQPSPDNPQPVQERTNVKTLADSSLESRPDLATGDGKVQLIVTENAKHVLPKAGHSQVSKHNEALLTFCNPQLLISLSDLRRSIPNGYGSTTSLTRLTAQKGNVRHDEPLLQVRITCSNVALDSIQDSISTAEKEKSKPRVMRSKDRSIDLEQSRIDSLEQDLEQSERSFEWILDRNVHDIQKQQHSANQMLANSGLFGKSPSGHAYLPLLLKRFTDKSSWIDSLKNDDEPSKREDGFFIQSGVSTSDHDHLESSAFIDKKELRIEEDIDQEDDKRKSRLKGHESSLYEVGDLQWQEHVFQFFHDSGQFQSTQSEHTDITRKKEDVAHALKDDTESPKVIHIPKDDEHVTTDVNRTQIVATGTHESDHLARIKSFKEQNQFETNSFQSREPELARIANKVQYSSDDGINHQGQHSIVSHDEKDSKTYAALASEMVNRRIQSERVTGSSVCQILAGSDEISDFQAGAKKVVEKVAIGLIDEVSSPNKGKYVYINSVTDEGDMIEAVQNDSYNCQTTFKPYFPPKYQQLVTERYLRNSPRSSQSPSRPRDLFSTMHQEYQNRSVPSLPEVDIGIDDLKLKVETPHSSSTNWSPLLDTTNARLSSQTQLQPHARDYFQKRTKSQMKKERRKQKWKRRREQERNCCSDGMDISQSPEITPKLSMPQTYEKHTTKIGIIHHDRGDSHASKFSKSNFVPEETLRSKSVLKTGHEKDIIIRSSTWMADKVTNSFKERFSSDERQGRSFNARRHWEAAHPRGGKSLSKMELKQPDVENDILDAPPPNDMLSSVHTFFCEKPDISIEVFEWARVSNFNKIWDLQSKEDDFRLSIEERISAPKPQTSFPRTAFEFPPSEGSSPEFITSKWKQELKNKQENMLHSTQSDSQGLPLENTRRAARTESERSGDNFQERRIHIEGFSVHQTELECDFRSATSERFELLQERKQELVRNVENHDGVVAAGVDNFGVTKGCRSLEKYQKSSKVLAVVTKQREGNQQTDPSNFMKRATADREQQPQVITGKQVSNTFLVTPKAQCGNRYHQTKLYTPERGSEDTPRTKNSKGVVVFQTGIQNSLRREESRIENSVEITDISRKATKVVILSRSFSREDKEKCEKELVQGGMKEIDTNEETVVKKDPWRQLELELERNLVYEDGNLSYRNV